MLRSFLGSCTVAALTFVVACSGGIAPDEDGAGSPGGASSSGSSTSPGVSDTPSPSVGRVLDTSSATSVVVARGWCGGAPGTCNGQHSFEVTFATSTLERRDCVPGATDPDTGGRLPAGSTSTKRVLTAAELQIVREKLAGVHTSTQPFEKYYDGAMFVLSVKTPSGTQDFSPQPSCNFGQFSRVVGFEALWSAISEL